MSTYLAVGVLPLFIYAIFSLSSAIRTATASSRFPVSKKAVVTNGIGLTLAAVRYHAPAEITRLRLF